MDIDHIRKLASLEQGRQYLEGRFGPKEVSATAAVLLTKAGSADDPGLLRLASKMSGDTLQNYELLGGTFEKAALGAPMFQMSVPGAPALKPPAPRVGPAQPSAQGASAGGGGGSIPQVSEPKIPGQQQLQGAGQGTSAAQ